MSISLEQIAAHIGAEFGSASDEVKNTPVSGVNSPQNASHSEITFIASEAYLSALAETSALAVIIHPDIANSSPVPALLHSQPYLAYAQISALFAPEWSSQGIHTTAVIGENVEIGADVIIGANTVIADGARIGRGSKIAANVVIGEHTVVGERAMIYPNVTLYHGISLGNDCIVHSGTVIGSDGFGFAPTAEGWMKIHQLGVVEIGDRVEIGANCTIDRGALGATSIAAGVKIDNLVHVAHNVEIGENTAIAGQVGIAGSSKIGKNCMFGGQAGVAGHIEITDKVTVTGQGMITKSIDNPGVYSSGTAFSEASVWRKNVARFQQLDTLCRRLIKLEKKVGTK